MNDCPSMRQASWPARALVLFACMLLGVLAAVAGDALLAYVEAVHGIDAPLVRMIPGAVFLALILGLPPLATRGHRRGVRKVNRDQFADAIPDFQQTYAFFSRHAWLDRYRALFLFDASAVGYREAALLCIAHCHDRIGDLPGYRAYLERTLAEFPDSRMTRNSLQTPNAPEADREDR